MSKTNAELLKNALAALLVLVVIALGTGVVMMVWH